MNNTTGQTPGIANTASGAADLPEALIGAIMAAAYDFRDAHISGSKNLKRTAHAELESTVRNTLHALAAGQATAAQAGVPANMQVTEKMRAAGDCAWMTADRVDSARVFRAMLAAAATQPARADSARLGGKP